VTSSFADLVAVSDAVAATPSRGAKVRLLADLLKRLAPADLDLVVTNPGATLSSNVLTARLVKGALVLPVRLNLKTP